MGQQSCSTQAETQRLTFRVIRKDACVRGEFDALAASRCVVARLLLQLRSCFDPVIIYLYIVLTQSNRK